jgi:hypothetical protein
VLFANPRYKQKVEELIQVCQQRDIGTMTIKAICKGPYGGGGKTFNTWYEPFTNPELIQRGVDFALSQPVTGLCTVGEASLLPTVLHACQNYHWLSVDEQAALITTASDFVPLWS